MMDGQLYYHNAGPGSTQKEASNHLFVISKLASFTEQKWEDKQKGKEKKPEEPQTAVGDLVLSVTDDASLAYGVPFGTTKVTACSLLL